MTEAELTYQMVAMMGMFFSGISVVFTIVSAYIVGLYWFLARAALPLRIVSFGIFSFALLLIAVVVFGLARHSFGLMLALSHLQEAQNLSPLGGMTISGTAQGVTNLIYGGVSILALFLYFGIFYLTFFYDWSEREYKKPGLSQSDPS